ncbi:MAG: efflux transporter, family, subunit, partial [Verrucomicrobiales bacterium]|nr:efflux transporter, family, subunit [Verrucomicrobiales bacterium]
MSLNVPSTRMPRWLPISSAVLALASCSPKTAPPKSGGKPATIPVVVTKAVKKDVPLILPSIGSVQPRATVTVRPQVGGQLSEVQIREGDFVKKGDLLFTIDSRPFDVALAQANAALDQAKAEAANATAQEERYVKLDRSGSVSAELVEQVRTASVTALSKVTAAESQVSQAKLELEYCRITAPLGGRAGRLLLDPGNIVQANLTDLTVINEIQPIEVSFTLAGRHLDALRQYSTADAQGSGLQVMVVPEGSTTANEAGTVAFFDNTVRPATGTIEVRAIFPNEKQTLWPGQFTDVRLRLTETRGAVTVPVKAIQTGQKGQFVYVIAP